MKSLIARVYTFLAFPAFLALIGFQVWEIDRRHEAEIHKARQELRTVAGWLTDVAIKHQGFPEKALKGLFPWVAQNGRWKSLALFSDERGLEYFYGPAPASGIPAPDLVTGKVIPSLSPSVPYLQESISLKVYAPDAKAYTLTGRLQVLSETEVFERLRWLILGLLGLLGLSSIILILTRAAELREGPDGETIHAETKPREEPRDFSVHTLRSDNLPNDDYWFEDEEMESPPGSDSSSHPFADTLPPLEGMPELEPRERSVESSPTSAIRTQGDPQPFSPRSGVSWGTFLSQRLDFELERCASFNQDLTLLLLSCPELVARPDEVYPLLGEALGSFYQFKDLDFEYNDEGFAVICPNLSLEAAIKDLTFFLRKIEHRWPQYHLYGGLSSRNGRLIESATILREAQKALEKAETGMERIVGFKSDPDRYRQFLATPTSEAG